MAESMAGLSFGNSSKMDCWALIRVQNYTTRFWAETFSLSIMNSLVILGNFLVALAPFLNRRLRNPGHHFIASLAWADFALGVFVIPFAAFTQTRGGVWPYGAHACQLWQTLDCMLCTTSIYSLIAITFDRFVAVSKPLMYKSWMTTKTCAIVIMIVWLGSFAVSLPSLPLTWARNERMVNTACKCTAAANGSVFILFSSIASFFLPMLIVLYFYAHIYVTVRKIRLNATRGVVNIRRRSPTTTTGGVTSMNNNTEFQEAFFEASTLAVSTMEVHNKKLFTYNRIKKSRKTTKSLGDEPKMEKIQDERATLLPPETPQHHRRISDGPVLRIHKGRYHARRLSGKKAVELKAVPPNKVSSASSITVEVPKADENDYVTRPWTNLKTRLAIPERLRPPPSPTRLAPSPDRSPSPSPSQLTLSAIGMPTDFDKAPETQKSISPQLSQRDLDASQKQDTIDEEKNAMTTDMWLRLALPSQLVSAWAQRMLALHRYRRKLSLELRALKTVVMVTGCFFVCWTGFCVVFTMQALPTCHKSNWWSWTKEPRSDDSCIPDWIFNFFVWLGYANSAANPIVYGAMNAQFRRTFRRMMEKVTGRSRMI